MTQDIWNSEPWHCGFENGCIQGWHRRTYWCGDQWSVDEYSDGDHEAIEQADIPAYEDIRAAWQEYYEYVAATGQDPLGAMIVDTPGPKAVKWQAKFRKCILGYNFCGARRNSRGPWITDARNLPPYVREFLDLAPASKQPPDEARIWVYQAPFSEDTRGNWPTLEADLASCEQARIQRSRYGIKFICEIDEPPKQKDVSRYLKRAAKAALAAPSDPA